MAIPAITTGLPIDGWLVDSDANGAGRIGVDHLVNLPAAIDHHEVNVYRSRHRGAIDHGGSSAIRIDRGRSQCRVYTPALAACHLQPRDLLA